LHKGDLRVQLAHADLEEILVCHVERRVGISRRAPGSFTLPILQVDCVNQGGLVAFLCDDFKTEDGLDLGNQVLAQSLIQVGSHHSENVF